MLPCSGSVCCPWHLVAELRWHRWLLLQVQQVVFPALGQGQGAWGPRSHQPTLLYVEPRAWGGGHLELPSTQQGAPSSPAGGLWAAVGPALPCPALPPVYLGLFGALPGDQRGLMGTRLLWGWFRADLQPGIEQELCSMPGALQSCSLIWSGNFSARRKSGAREPIWTHPGRPEP